MFVIAILDIFNLWLHGSIESLVRVGIAQEMYNYYRDTIGDWSNPGNLL